MAKSKYMHRRTGSLARQFQKIACATVVIACVLAQHTAIGQVIVWGDNIRGPISVPTSVTNAVAIACGYSHGLALRANGTVAAWGDNSYGQTKVPAGLSNVVEVGAGGIFSCALTAGGRVIAWGNSAFGQTNVPTGLSNVVEIAVGKEHCLALTGEGRVVAWGDNSSGQTTVPASLSNIVAVAAGDSFSLAVTVEGLVRAWGNSTFGQTTVPPGLSNVIAVAAGTYHCLALQSGGTVVAWGSNSRGMNVPAGLSNVVSVAAGTQHGLALKEDGQLVGWGSYWNGFGYVPMTPGLSNVLAISAAGNSSLALTGASSPTIIQQPSSRFLYAGETAVIHVRALGQLPLSYQWRANGTNLANGGRVFGADTATIALTETVTNDAVNYSVVISNASGSVTSEVATVVFWPPLAVALNTTNVAWSTTGAATWLVHNYVTHDGAFAARSGAITNTQATWIQTSVMGPGALGFWWKVSSESDYDFLRFRVDDVEVDAISGEVDWEHRVRYLGVGAHIVQWVYAKDEWAASGQDVGWLDEVSFTPGGTAPQIQTQPRGINLAAGLTATFKVTAFGTPPLAGLWLHKGAVLAVITNDTFAVTNVQVTNEGDYQVIITNNFGAVTSQVATLTVTPCIPVITSQPKSQGVLKGRGLDFGVGVRGSEALTFQWFKDETPMMEKTNATLRFAKFDDDDVGAYYVIVSNVYGAVTSSVARVAITRIVAWGRNNWGQADVPASATNVVAVAAGFNFSAALRDDGSVVAWGANNHGQLDVPAGLSNVVALAAGQHHCLALRADGTVAAWGAGTNNTGSSPNHGQSLVPAGLSNVVAIAAGTEHNLAVRADGTVIAWGDNLFKQSAVPAGLSNVVMVDGGVLSSLVLRADGTVVMWGDDSFYGSTNMPVGLGNVVALSMYCSHTLALLADGNVLAWGDNSYGQTNVPVDLANVVAVAAGNSQSLALRADGTMVTWGTNNYSQIDFPVGLSNVVAIACGDMHALALVGDGPPATRAVSACPTRSSAGFSLQIPTRNGCVYALEYKNALTETNWQALPFISGNGGFQTFMDPAAPVGARFYRVRCW